MPPFIPGSNPNLFDKCHTQTLECQSEDCVRNTRCHRLFFILNLVLIVCGRRRCCSGCSAARLCTARQKGWIALMNLRRGSKNLMELGCWANNAVGNNQILVCSAEWTTCPLIAVLPSLQGPTLLDFLSKITYKMLSTVVIDNFVFTSPCSY